MTGPVFFIHSRCCRAHWELVWTGEGYDLLCEECHTPAGVQVSGPDLRERRCEACQPGKEGQKP